MAKRDRRIDAYIAKSPEFARPILAHLREVVHAACPETEETLKWSAPTFMYHGMLCGMASFKQHCTFGFWKAKLVLGDGAGDVESAWGQFGRITRLRDLPSKRVITGYVKKAMALNEAGVKVARRTAPRKALPTPADLKAALQNSRKALAAFEAFSPSMRREYVEWIVEAKRPETRAKRIATAVEWMAEGRKRNWKYENC
jgi:uncharacterized protein YdeI (YjbR/CyaY-like superfamily)